MPLRALSLLLVSAAVLTAQEATPHWGLGLLGGRESGDGSRLCGHPFGAELSWHLLQGHWVEGRVRATYLRFGFGEGGVTHSPAYVYRDSLRAEYAILSSDWICSLQKPRGPYLLAGVGWHFGEQEFRHEMSPLLPGAEPEIQTHRDPSNFFAFSLGAGYQIRHRAEVELRWDFLPDPGVAFQGWGGESETHRDLSALNLAVRFRF